MNAFAFSDLFYSDRRPALNVRASITLLPATPRLRRSDKECRWRPNHNFGPIDGREFYIGQVEFKASETIEPGQTLEALVRFLDGPGLKEKLIPGQLWRIQEGPTLVGTGKVVEVIHET